MLNLNIKIITSLLLCALILNSCRHNSSESIKLSYNAFMISIGSKKQIHVMDIQTGKPVKAQWVSDNSDIAIVDKNGLVKSVSKGNATITATIASTGATASCMVSVDVPFQNPVLPPSWDLYIADPEPKHYGNGVYVYGSRDTENGVLPSGVSWCSDRYNVLYSEDLIHWADKGESFHLDSIPEQYRHPQYKRLWAPDVLRNPADGKYYLYFCFNHTHPVREEIFMVAISDKPEGPFSDPKPLMIDGKETIQAIDPGVLVDDDGKAYVTWPFKMGQLDPNDFTNIIGSTVVDIQQWMPEDNTPFEGPSLRKREDTYYYIYIENEGLRMRPDGTRHNKPTRMVYMTSKNPLGPYTYQGLIMTTSGYPGVINIHGSLVEFNSNWYVFYHIPVIDKKLTRAMCIEPLSFNDDGTIIPVEPSTSGIKGTFVFGDRINAAGAVIYPGGELNPEFVSRKNDYAKLVFTKPGSYAGYKYFDPGTVHTGKITLNVETTAGNAVLEIRLDTVDGELVSEIKLPDTHGKWKEVSVEANNLQSGKNNFFIILKDNPETASIGIDHFMFSEK